MGRRSSLERMPPELQDVYHRLVRAGCTIMEITDKLNELDADVSKSAVGRAVKGARAQMRQYREAQEVAGQWVAQLNEQPKGDVSALLTEMLKTVAYSTIASIGDGSEAELGKDGKPKAPKPMDIMLLAKAIKDLESSTKQSLDRRAAIEKAVLTRAADVAGEVGARNGLSQTAIDEIQRELRLL